MSVLPVGIAASGDEAYTIEDSLRFRSSASAYLTRTFGTATSSTTGTWSCWVKRGTISSGTGQDIWSSSNYEFLRFGTNDTLTIPYLGNLGYVYSTAVYRDPSAWYHIVLVFDTSNGTANDRMRLYVNGERQTLSWGATPQTQNATFQRWNVSGYTGDIGDFQYNHTYFFDGYLTEINWIDGQALDPTDFGEFDGTTGVWKPKEYTGTYGNNGFYLDFSNGATKHSVTANGNVQHSTTQSKIGGSSVYFDGSGDYLTTEYTSDFDIPINGEFTIEGWVYPTTSSYWRALFEYNYGGGGYSTQARMDGSSFDGIYVDINNTYYLFSWSLNTWQHVAIVFTGSLVRVFVDGTEITSVAYSSSRAYTPQAFTGPDNFSIGSDQWSPSGWLGFFDEIRVSNTARYTGSFTPSTTSFADDSNTLLLIHSDTTNGSTTFVDSSGVEGGPGNDQSGQANHWTPNNINSSISSSTTYDLMTDVPTLTDEDTANFATLNPVDAYPGRMFAVDGNLKWNDTSGGSWGRSTISPTSGKWYWEVSDFSTTNWLIGVSDGDQSITNYYAYYSGAPTALVYLINGQKYVAGSASSFISAIATTDVVGFAVDADAGSLAVYKNGTLQGTITGLSYGSYSPMVAPPAVGSCVFNFGQRPFAYTPPTGFLKLNTYNLPDATIEDGSEHFNTVLYTGTAATQSITGVGFQPDFTWIKNRSAVQHHNLFDVVRGAGKLLYSTLADAEATSSTHLNSFDSDGFTIGSATSSNGSGNSIVSWNWKANGSGVSNSAGTNGASIASTYSANTTSGFSVVTYTGTGSNGTIYHGLGKAPDMMIFKTRSTSNNWFLYHSAVGVGSNPAAYRMLFNLTNNRAANGTFLNNTQPTATVATIGTDSGTNQSGITYVSYHFASIEGFSKFGSYMGNGNANGPFIYTGFRPAYVLTKVINNTGSWFVWDTARDTYNWAYKWLSPNSSSAENTSGGANVWDIDIVSNGFKIRNNGSFANGSGYTYLYAAFAENPFKNALAR